MAVARRMRGLSRVEREILMRAAAIGDRFDLSLLRAVVARADEVVIAAVGRACDLQIVVADDAVAGGYRFRHALTREIVYAELQHERVGRIHRRIARALEASSMGEDVPIDRLAYHYWVGGDVRRALTYNERAGDLAAAAHAASDARRLYLRACECAAWESPAHRRLIAKIRALDVEGN